MKKGIWLGNVDKELPIEERLRLIKDAGFPGIEAVTLEDDEFESMRKAVEAAGLEVHSVMNTGPDNPPLSSPDSKEVKQGLARARQTIKTAGALGADSILLVPARVTESVTYEEAMKRSRESIPELIPFAEKHNVTIAIENVWNKFLLSPLEFVDYVDGFGSRYVRAYFDVGNIVVYGYPQHWIKSLGARIAKVHLKDYSVSQKAFVPLTEGDVNWPAVMAQLRAAGYTGYLTSEVSLGKETIESYLRNLSASIDEVMAM